MTSPLTRKYAPYLLTAGLATAAFSSSCSKEESTEPKVVEPDKYVLKDVRYFFTADSRIDTALVNLAGLRVQNPSNTLSSQQVEGGFGELMKTSQFELEPTTSLPKEVELNEFELQVPQHWYGNELFDYSTAAFPLSVTPQEKPYGFDPEHLLTIRIPPKSQITISRQIDAYRLACSFQCVLENTTTGQRYSIRGKWKGLLQYGNPSVTLKQSPL
ncbi:hypothetical protein [Hymenobacter sp.]|jgi:hypothetical protein|uniref:hypothetical protein n=1 Tax=Hymenobacter sp. TaxID=1898978 RepID=UPI002ED7C8AE